MKETGYILITGCAAPKYMGEVGAVYQNDKSRATFLYAARTRSYGAIHFLGSDFVYITKEQYESEAFRKTMKAFYGTPIEE